MNKENLFTKVNTLLENVQFKQTELETAQKELNEAKQELANAGKPKIPSKLADDLVDAMQEIITDILHNISNDDLDVEFGMDYGNTVVLEHIDFSNIGVSESDIYTVLQDMFNIVEDEDDDNS